MPADFNHYVGTGVTVRTPQFDQDTTNDYSLPPQKYVADMINSNNTVLSDINVVLWGLNCYITYVFEDIIEVLVTPGVVLNGSGADDSPNQVIHVDSCNLLRLQLPAIANIATSNTFGIFVVRHSVIGSSDTYTLEMHGLRIDESFIGLGDVSVFNPLIASSESYHLLQFYKFELDVNNRFTKLEPEAIAQNLNIKMLISIT